MMRFDSYYDRNPAPERKLRWQFENARWFTLRANMWPTVDESEDIVAALTADTVLQILRGQGIYWGYECERHTSNYIHARKVEKRVVDTRVRKSEFKKLGKFKPESEFKPNVYRAGQVYKAQNKHIRKVIRYTARFRNITIDEATNMVVQLTGQTNI